MNLRTILCCYGILLWNNQSIEDFMQISFEYFSDPLSTFLHNCIILSAARFSVRRCLDRSTCYRSTPPYFLTIFFLAHLNQLMVMAHFCINLAVLVEHRKKKYINKALSLSLQSDLGFFPLFSYFLSYSFLNYYFLLITSRKITQSNQSKCLKLLWVNICSKD